MSEQADVTVELKLGLINAILQYLGTRPYQEVFPLVQGIQAAVIPQLPAQAQSAPTQEQAAPAEVMQ